MRARNGEPLIENGFGCYKFTSNIVVLAVMWKNALPLFNFKRLSTHKTAVLKGRLTDGVSLTWILNCFCVIVLLLLLAFLGMSWNA